jgi:hypothetical protein
MARKIVLADTTASWGGAACTWRKGETVEATAAMITAIGAGNLRDAAGVAAGACSPSRSAGTRDRRL